MLLRESMFVKGILFNAEVLYGLTKSEIAEFEKLDRLLLRRILQVPFSTPQESFYLELGILPLGVVIKKRRLQYLHNLVNRNKEEMLYQVFITQWNNPTKGDWTVTVRENLVEFGFCEEYEFLKTQSKLSFKNTLKKKAKEVALDELLERQSKHSKMDNVNYSELAIQKYFLLHGINVQEIRSVFRFRTRMAPYGENFRGNRDCVQCPLCSTHVDSQVLGLNCPAIRKIFNIDCDIQDVYSDSVTIDTAKTLTKILAIRKELMEQE